MIDAISVSISPIMRINAHKASAILRNDSGARTRHNGQHMTNERDLIIAQREYIARICDIMSCKPSYLATKIGAAPSTINKFIEKEVPKHALSSITLMKLADYSRIPFEYTGMKFNGAGILYSADEDLMQKAASAVISAAQSARRNLNLEETMAYTVMLYNHAIRYRAKEMNTEPTEAMASLILDKQLNQRLS